MFKFFCKTILLTSIAISLPIDASAGKEPAKKAEAECTAQDTATLLTFRPVWSTVNRIFGQLEHNQRLTQQEYQSLKKDFFMQCNLLTSICQRLSDPIKQKLNGGIQGIVNGIDGMKQAVTQLDDERRKRLLDEQTALAAQDRGYANRPLTFMSIAVNDTPETNYPLLHYRPCAQESESSDFSRALVQGGEAGRMLIERFEKNAHEMNKQDDEGWTPLLQLAAHGHTKLLSESLMILIAKHYTPQKQYYQEHVKEAADFFSIITFDASSSTYTLPSKTFAHASTQAEQFPASSDPQTTRLIPTAQGSESTCSGGSAGSAGAHTLLATPIPPTATLPATAAAAPTDTTDVALPVYATDSNERRIFINSKKFRPFVCQAVMVPKKANNKTTTQSTVHAPSAVVLTGLEAYFFVKHLDVRAQTYPNMTVIDGMQDQQKFHKEQADYQTQLQTTIADALAAPRKTLSAAEEPISLIEVKEIRRLIGSYVATDAPYAKKPSVTTKKKSLCPIQ